MSEDIDMPDPRSARRKDPEGVKLEAWKGTLDDMEAIAEERREDGWDVLTLTAAHTDTVSKDMGDHDEFGLFHVVPDNHAEEFEEWFDPDEFTEYLAYGTDVEGFMYTVTEFIDSDTERSILLASRYDMVRADGLVESAVEEGVLYSHIKTIDGTTLGKFPHEEFSPLLKRPS